MSIAGMVVVVTGGATGIGLACARRFAKNGAKVVIADTSDADGKSASDTIKENGGDVIFINCDVGERLDVHNLIAAALDNFQRIDALVNNASIRVRSDFLSLKEDDFDEVIRTNLKGAFLTAQAVAKQMISQIEAGDGMASGAGSPYSIVNISSINAVIAAPEEASFSVSQGGLNQLTKVMALTLAPRGIRVNAIGPGSVMTEFMKTELTDSEARSRVLSRTPLGRIGDPDEIASIAQFLISEDASYMTGQTLYADGGRLVLNDNLAAAK